MIAVRYLPPGLPALSITYVGAIASLATIVPLWVLFGERVPLNWGAHWWQFLLLAACSLAAAQSLNIAYRSAPASVAGSLEYVSILFATGLAWMTQGLIPPVGIWFGVSLITIAGLVTAWRESGIGNEPSLSPHLSKRIGRFQPIGASGTAGMAGDHVKSLYVAHVQPKIHVLSQPRLHSLQPNSSRPGKGNVGAKLAWFGLKSSILTGAVHLIF